MPFQLLPTLRPRSLALATFVGAMSAMEGSGAIVISAGHWEFSAGTTEARINLRVFNDGETVELGGVDVSVELDDGGITGGTASILNVDLVPPGALFADNYDSLGGAGAISPRLFEVNARTPTGSTVFLGNGDRLLAHVFLDLSDMVPGDYLNLRLVTGTGSTRFLDALGNTVDATLIDGRVQIAAVPESQSFAIAAGVLLLGMGIWRRGKR